MFAGTKAIVAQLALGAERIEEDLVVPPDLDVVEGATVHETVVGDVEDVVRFPVWEVPLEEFQTPVDSLRQAASENHLVDQADSTDRESSAATRDLVLNVTTAEHGSRLVVPVPLPQTIGDPSLAVSHPLLALKPRFALAFKLAACSTSLHSKLLSAPRRFLFSRPKEPQKALSFECFFVCADQSGFGVTLVLGLGPPLQLSHHLGKDVDDPIDVGVREAVALPISSRETWAELLDSTRASQRFCTSGRPPSPGNPADSSRQLTSSWRSRRCYYAASAAAFSVEGLQPTC